MNEKFYAAIGYRVFREHRGSGIALRFDAVERLLREARRLGGQGPFVATPVLCALANCNPPDLIPVLTNLGFIAAADGGVVNFRLRRKHSREQRHKNKQSHAKPSKKNSDSPFAKLRDLDLGT